jgi:hypothetical protein
MVAVVIQRGAALTVAGMALGSATFAQTTDNGRGEMPVQIREIERMHVTPRGVVYDSGDDFSPRGCQDIRTHTNADFSGGSYVAQLGFAQNEIAAVTYDVPAGQFPIRIDFTEMIFVTSNANTQTVTEWTIYFWDGDPETGIPVASYSSDDVILPHMRIGPGTAGLNLAFGIDPGDPEQIIISNTSGQARFSFGVQINRHNNPPNNPCLQAPPQTSNAFPTTDFGGLAAPGGNWLNGLNCGPFGCPPNGGWETFGGLSSACRPSGDWVMRATYTPVNCTPGVGACCISGVCSVQSQTNCVNQGGTYQGDGTSCATTNCPQSTQACCFQSTGGCLNLTPANCASAGGISGGPGTACATYVCFPMGACCLPDGSCVGPVSPSTCQSQGGTFQGNGSSCATVNCPDPVGACCFPTQFCLVLTEAECAAAGATWHGLGSDCDAPDICQAACPGDVNGDDVVNLTDLSTLLTNFGRSGDAQRSHGDLDGDQDVDLVDLATLLTNFGSSCP